MHTDITQDTLFHAWHELHCVWCSDTHREARRESTDEAAQEYVEGQMLSGGKEKGEGKKETRVQDLATLTGSGNCLSLALSLTSSSLRSITLPFSLCVLLCCTINYS